MRQGKGFGKMDDLKHRLRDASFIAFDDGGNDYTTAQDALSAIEALESQVRAADALAEQVQRVKDFRYDPNIGIELNRLEEALTAYRATKEGGAL